MMGHFFVFILKIFRILQKVTYYMISLPNLTPIVTPNASYDFSEIRVFCHTPALHLVGESA